ncbi:MAG: hypothetical protein WCP39_04295, partial [Chlamydiota bacterium]
MSTSNTTTTVNNNSHAYRILFDEFTIAETPQDYNPQIYNMFFEKVHPNEQDHLFYIGDPHNKPHSQKCFEEHLTDREFLVKKEFPDTHPKAPNLPFISTKLSPDTHLFFLGDYMHRGAPNDCDLSFFLHILQLKMQNREQIHLCKGNHESISLCTQPCYSSPSMQSIQNDPLLRKSLHQLFENALPSLFAITKKEDHHSCILALHGLPELDLTSWLPAWLATTGQYFFFPKNLPISLPPSAIQLLEGLLSTRELAPFSPQELSLLLPEFEKFLESKDESLTICKNETIHIVSRKIIKKLWPILYLENLFNTPYPVLPAETPVPLRFALQKERDTGNGLTHWGRPGTTDCNGDTGPLVSSSTLEALKKLAKLLGLDFNVIRGHDHVLSSTQKFIYTVSASPTLNTDEEHAILHLRVTTPHPDEWSSKILVRPQSQTGFTKEKHGLPLRHLHTLISPPARAQTPSEETPPPQAFSIPLFPSPPEFIPMLPPSVTSLSRQRSISSLTSESSTIPTPLFNTPSPHEPTPSTTLPNLPQNSTPAPQISETSSISLAPFTSPSPQKSMPATTPPVSLPSFSLASTLNTASFQNFCSESPSPAAVLPIEFTFPPPEDTSIDEEEEEENPFSFLSNTSMPHTSQNTNHSLANSKPTTSFSLSDWLQDNPHKSKFKRRPPVSHNFSSAIPT